jgi:phage-related minor tail protein
MIKQYRVELQGDDAGLLSTLRDADQALGANERAYGTLAQQMARATASSSRFTTATEAQTVALRSAADGERAMVGIRAAAEQHQRRQIQTGQDFVASLTRQADSVGKTRAELLALQAAQLGVSEKAAPLIARIAASDARFQSFNKTGRLTALELQQVGFQLNDLGVQLASGQNPLTALIQQGSQLSGTFGGIRPALSAVASLITPFRVGVAGAAAGTLALAAAWVQGYRESRQFQDGLTLTGNAAGQTAGQFEALIGRVATLGNVSKGAARDAAQAVSASGRFGPQNVEGVTQAVTTLQKFTGEATDDIVKQFGGITSGVAKWAAEQNKAYNFLTPKIYDQIRALEAQGRTQDAIGVAVAALNEKFAGQTRNLGLLERGWDAARRAMSNFWDTLKGLGRDETSEERLERLNRRLAELQAGAEGARRAGFRQPRQDAERQAAESARNAEARRFLRERDNAAAAAAAAEENQREIERQSDSHQAALAAIEKAGFLQRAAAGEVALTNQRIALERSYEEGELALAVYVRRRGELERQAIAAKEQAIDNDIALEAKRKVGNETDARQQEARIAELRARRIQLQGERARLADEEQRNFGATDERVTRPVASDALRRLRPADDAAGLEFLRQQRDQADQLAHQLVLDTRTISTGLILDARQRAEALLAIEVERLRRTLDLETRNAEDRARVEQQLADYIVERERQITEELKPEWQRQVELYEDYSRRRIQVNDDVNAAFVNGGRAAFGQMFVDGKLSFDSLRDYALRTLGEQFFERMGFGRTFAQLGDILFGGIERVTGNVFGGSDNPSPERDALRQLEAAAAEQIAQTVASTAAASTEAAATTAAAGAMSTFTLAGVQPATGALVEFTRATLAAAGAAGSQAASSGGGGLFGAIADWFTGGGGDTGTGVPGIGDGGGMGFPMALGDVVGRVAQRFAKGAMFDGRGSLLTSRAQFRMAQGGVGEAGEAGYEAVMPLRRTPSGRLGVESMGSAAQQSVTVNVHGAPSQPEVRRRQDRNGMTIDLLFDQFRNRLSDEVDSGAGLAGPIGNRFALNGGAGLIS